MGRTAHPTAGRGLTLLEVMIALVILGLIASVYLVTSRMSQKNTGKSTDWQVESVAIDKTVERLHLIQNLSTLRGYRDSLTDSTSKLLVDVTVRGSTPSAVVCGSFCGGGGSGGVAEISIKAKRRNFSDSIVVTTYLFAKNP
jgi:prepilin-type N-terminal cleavage/methylation domain-containing protein